MRRYAVPEIEDTRMGGDKWEFTVVGQHGDLAGSILIRGTATKTTARRYRSYWLKQGYTVTPIIPIRMES